MSVEVLKAKHDILISLGKLPDQAEIEAIRDYKNEIAAKRKEVTREEGLSQFFGQSHLIFAISVTLLAAGISLSGMSVIVSQKWLWAVGLAIGALGAVGIILGIISMLV